MQSESKSQPEGPLSLCKRIMASRRMLTELNLQSCNLMPSDCLEIASSQKSASLRTLDVSCNPIGFKGILNLFNARTSNLGRLENFFAFNCSLKPSSETRVAAEAMEKSKSACMVKLSDLRVLNLSHNELTEFLHAISLNFFGQKVETLLLVDIKGQQRDCDLVDWLSGCLHMLKGLRSLDVSLNGASVQVDKLLHVIQASSLRKLETLSAQDCTASQNPEPLAKNSTGGDEFSDGLTNLRRLELCGSLCQLEQMKLVTDSEALSGLQYLNMSRCAVDEDILSQIFHRSACLKNVEVLGMASMLNLNQPTETRTFNFTIPTRKHGFAFMRKLRVLDLRENKGLWVNTLERSCFDSVTVFAWQGGRSNQALKPVNSYYESLHNGSCQPDTDENRLMHLRKNPLHIVAPTEEQIELANELFFK